MLDEIRKLLGGKQSKKKSLNDLSDGDLHRESVRLEHAKKQLLDKLEDLESEKNRLFEKGVKEPSPTRKLDIARSIKRLDVRIGQVNRVQQSVAKQITIIDGLRGLKEVQTTARDGESPMSFLNELDAAELQIQIDDLVVDTTYQEEKLTRLSSVVSEGINAAGESGEDEDVLKIVSMFDQMSVGKHEQELEDILEQMDSAASAGHEATQQERGED